MEEDTKQGQPDLAKPVWLGDIAACDPKLAWTLLEVGKAQDGYVDMGGWETLTLLARWDSGAANQNVPGVQRGLVGADLWVRDVSYTVRRPDFAAGSIFKGQSDHFNALNPNIDYQLQVNSRIRYLISSDFTPLENIRGNFLRHTPAGFVLQCSAEIRATFTNLRAFTGLEVPTEAAITFHGTRLPTGLYGMCSEVQARALLKELRLLAE